MDTIWGLQRLNITSIQQLVHLPPKFPQLGSAICKGFMQGAWH